MGQNRNIIIATIKSWNIEKAKIIKTKYDEKYNIKIITKKEELNIEDIDKINPKYIFFPHWSWIIPKEIYKKYNCIVFHMTDLPYGRGGSPLQNLIERGHKKTKISAIKVEKGLDTGDIYIKEPLSLEGTAEEIYKRASEIIFEKMIPKIIEKNLTPYPQKGKVVEFKRRKPNQSDISKLNTLEKIYDYIRMLDAEGYPKAYIREDGIKYEFYDAKIEGNEIQAKVKITKDDEK
jgi:methionyl-tRNA formyltransferase